MLSALDDDAVTIDADRQHALGTGDGADGMIELGDDLPLPGSVIPEKPVCRTRHQPFFGGDKIVGAGKFGEGFRLCQCLVGQQWPVENRQRDRPFVPAEQLAKEIHAGFLQ